MVRHDDNIYSLLRTVSTTYSQESSLSLLLHVWILDPERYEVSEEEELFDMHLPSPEHSSSDEQSSLELQRSRGRMLSSGRQIPLRHSLSVPQSSSLEQPSWQNPLTPHFSSETQSSSLSHSTQTSSDPQNRVPAHSSSLLQLR